MEKISVFGIASGGRTCFCGGLFCCQTERPNFFLKKVSTFYNN